MLMREWTRLLRNDGVKVWAVSPGFLATGLAGVGVEQLKKVSFVSEVCRGRELVLTDTRWARETRGLAGISRWRLSRGNVMLMLG